MPAAPFNLDAEINFETARRVNIVKTLDDLSDRTIVLDALDRIAASTGRLRALKIVRRAPDNMRRAKALISLCGMAQRETPTGNEGIAFAAERDMYAVLIERNLLTPSPEPA